MSYICLARLASWNFSRLPSARYCRFRLAFARERAPGATHLENLCAQLFDALDVLEGAKHPAASRLAGAVAPLGAAFFGVEAAAGGAADFAEGSKHWGRNLMLVPSGGAARGAEVKAELLGDFLDGRELEGLTQALAEA